MLLTRRARSRRGWRNKPRARDGKGLTAVKRAKEKQIGGRREVMERTRSKPLHRVKLCSIQITIFSMEKRRIPRVYQRQPFSRHFQSLGISPPTPHPTTHSRHKANQIPQYLRLLSLHPPPLPQRLYQSPVPSVCGSDDIPVHPEEHRHPRLHEFVILFLAEARR